MLDGPIAKDLEIVEICPQTFKVLKERLTTDHQSEGLSTAGQQGQSGMKSEAQHPVCLTQGRGPGSEPSGSD